MKLTGAGKVVLFLLVIGFGIGAWRMLTQATGSGQKGFSLPRRPGKTGGSDGSGVEILLMTSASKKGWMQEQIDLFNDQYNGQYRISTAFIETREGLHAILSGSKQPVLWSPSDVGWLVRLDEVWRQRQGKNLLDMENSASFRRYFRTPLVFVTTQSKADFLRPRIGSSTGWQKLRNLSTGREKAPWGRFRFACADPLSANSGLMTLGLMLFDYGQQTGMNQSFDKLAASGGFSAFLRDINRGIVFDEDAKAGSSALFKAFLSDPGRYDVITAYESSALQAAPSHRNLAVIYPRPTIVAEQSVAVLNGNWVSESQKQGAQEFLKFLSREESLRAGLKDHHRPVRAAGGLSLDTEIASMRSQGFQTDFAVAELPPYNALNRANVQWNNIISH